jgi:hypothetical protein
LAQQRLSAQQREQTIAKQIATGRIWTINRKTGDVSYMLNGKVSAIDRGRIVTVLNQEEAAIVFGVEMAVQKYGSRIACTGTDRWKRMVTMTAVNPPQRTKDGGTRPGPGNGRSGFMVSHPSPEKRRRMGHPHLREG